MFHQRLEIKSIYFARFVGTGRGQKEADSVCDFIRIFMCSYVSVCLFLESVCVCMCDENESFIIYFINNSSGVYLPVHTKQDI